MIARTLTLLTTLAALGCGSPARPTPPDPYPAGPRAICPAPLSITSTTGMPVPITYGTTTAEGGEPPVAVTCAPATGSVFNIATTSVTCTVTDARQRTDTCTFDVTVVAPPQIRLTRFAAFGDSITYGENGIASAPFDVFQPRVQVARTYPTVLYQALTGRYTTQAFVVANAGVPSEFASSADARSRFSSLVGSGLYEAVLVMEGSNDLGENRGAQALDALRRMVQEARGRGVTPFLATIPPMDGSFCCPRRGSAAPLVPGFNDGIRSIAASEGITLVDVYAVMSTADLSADGLHPNEAGYEKMGQAFFDAIRASLEVK